MGITCGSTILLFDAVSTGQESADPCLGGEGDFWSRAAADDTVDEVTGGTGVFDQRDESTRGERGGFK